MSYSFSSGGASSSNNDEAAEQGASSLVVAFAASPDDGGCPVTRYKIEWDPAGALGFAAGAASGRSLLYGENELQVVTVSAKQNDLGGFFRIALGAGGHRRSQPSPGAGGYDDDSLGDENAAAWAAAYGDDELYGGDFQAEWGGEGPGDAAFASDPIAAGASAAEVAAALNEVSTVGGVSVSRRELTHASPAANAASEEAAAGGSYGYGFAYTVTFLGHGGGRRWVGDVAPLRVSTDPSEFPSEFAAGGRAEGGTLTGTGAVAEVVTAVDGSRGFEQQQLLLAASSGRLRGSFRVGWGDRSSAPLPWNATAAQLTAALTALGTGPVRVAREIDQDAMNGFVGFSAPSDDYNGSSANAGVFNPLPSTFNGTQGIAAATDAGIRFVVVFERAAPAQRTGSGLPLIVVDGSELRSTDFGAAVAFNSSTLVAGETPTLDSSLKREVVLAAAAASSAPPATATAASNQFNADLDAAFDAATGTYRHVISGLSQGEAYHVRVSAWNGFGNAYGSPNYATPKYGLEKFGVR